MSPRRRRMSESVKRGRSPSPPGASDEGLGLPRNFVDMLGALHAARAEFLLIGGYALAVHGFRRATGDIDFWIRPTPRNASRVMRALRTFGAPLHDLTEADLALPATVFQIGIPPERIDVIGSIAGVRFDEAWSRRVEAVIAGVPVAVIGRAALLANKIAVGRPKDQIDADWLRSHPPKRRGRSPK
jgi:hypothetical protein